MAPPDKSYGQRELLILAPDGDLVCFGQSISKMPTNPQQPTKTTAVILCKAGDRPHHSYYLPGS